MAKAKALRVAVIGAGAGGIASAIRLREAGVTDIVIFEKGDRVGGTWRENRYPGLSCDVPSHLYRFSFAPNPEWTHRYAFGPEILRYFEKVARDFDVEKLVRFSTEVTAATYADGQWKIESNRGAEGLFDVVITSIGILHHPRYPDIESLSDFKGRVFHSARWPQDISLKEKRVGIIGTGSTATQILPAIVDTAAKVSLFQRTAQWIMPDPNLPIPDEKLAEYRADPEAMERQYRTLAKALNEGFSAAVVGENPGVYAEIERLCVEYLQNGVRDPALKKKLTPNYKVACKRLVISSIFYDAIQKPNAELVTDRISRVEANGVRTQDGRLHELDVLVLATGFDAHRFFGSMAVKGEGGLDLDEAWAESNFTYRAVTIPKFPNLFMLGGPTTPIGNFSYLMTMEHQLHYVMQLVALLASGEARAVAPKVAPATAYNAALREKVKGSVWASGCNNWYLDKTGTPASYPWSYANFAREMSAPVLEDFELV